MAEPNDKEASTSENFTEGQLLARRKQRKKRRQERLIQGLELMKNDQENNQVSDSPPPSKKSKKSKKNKKNKTVFETQEEARNEGDAIEEGGGGGRKYTVSLALAGSILDNAQSAELRTYLAGQIARALAVFSVDEVIIFDDEGRLKLEEGKEEEFDTKKPGAGGGCIQLARILQFLECPQYLRKAFFPIHPDLQYAGVLNPTDMPHHFRINEISKYREGVVTKAKSNKVKDGSVVDVGLKKDCLVDKSLEEGIRVTVELDLASEEKNLIRGKVVAPSTPRTKKGLYWGYNVRLVETLSQVFTKCPFKGGYDLTVGTSERGTDIDNCHLAKQEGTEEAGFKNLLVVFGGVKGLEVALEHDPELKGSVEDPSQLFDIYLNTCPHQGSRTIRTEEAVLITLSALRSKILQAQKQ